MLSTRKVLFRFLEGFDNGLQRTGENCTLYTVYCTQCTISSGDVYPEGLLLGNLERSYRGGLSAK